MAVNVNPLHLATEAWKDVFKSSPYSSLIMMDVIARHTRLSFKDILDKPKELKHFYENTIPNELQDPIFTDLSSFPVTGRCTSFAIQVVTLLEKEHKDKFNFEYFDVGRHRLARCKITGVVIDSSSEKGPYVLQESEKCIEKDATKLWRYFNGKLTIKKKPKPTKKTAEQPTKNMAEENTKSTAEQTVTKKKEEEKVASPISANLALGNCLREVAKDITFVCIFRSIKDVEASEQTWVSEFGGMLKWKIPAKGPGVIQLVPKREEKHSMMKISFSREGTPKTEEECLNNLRTFLKTSGNRQQWKDSSNAKVHAEFWAAAVELWGLPIFSPLAYFEN